MQQFTTRGSGYSAIRCSAALALVGMVLTISLIGRQFAAAWDQTDERARTLIDDIQAGHRAAVTSRTNVTLAITSSSYTLTASGGTVLRRQTLPSAFRVSTTCPARVCVFGAEGVPIAAGTVTLTSASTGRAHHIAIDPGTGRVSSQ